MFQQSNSPIPTDSRRLTSTIAGDHPPRCALAYDATPSFFLLWKIITRIQDILSMMRAVIVPGLFYCPSGISSGILHFGVRHTPTCHPLFSLLPFATTLTPPLGPSPPTTIPKDDNPTPPPQQTWYYYVAYGSKLWLKQTDNRRPLHLHL